MAQRTLRHLLAGAGIVVAGAAGYAGLRASSVFAVESVQVTGADGALGKEVEAEALALVGDRSLLALDADAVEARLRQLPGVQTVAVDRAFPHRLDVRLVPEIPVARLPYGNRQAVVARSGRVLSLVAGGGRDGLPSIAAAPADVPAPGGRVRAPLVLDGIAVADAARGMQGLELRSLRWTRDGLVARTGEDWQLRLGDAGEAGTKLATARALLRSLARDTRAELRYVDVSAPAVPVIRLQTSDPRTAAPSVVVTADAEAAADAAVAAIDGAGAPSSQDIPEGDASDVVLDLFGHGQPSGEG